ncbi:MAG TPA: DNA glycosylase [Oscillospiraceae bacterium]|nr:DNA glycosylase [Oscillospiraceae bacterium]
MEITVHEGGVSVRGFGGISLSETLDCGQCFRWAEKPDGGWRGVVRGICRTVYEEPEGIFIAGADEKEVRQIWLEYFDLPRDYAGLRERFSAVPLLREACAFAPGIRVLRQEPWEALITFLVSQNNNIPRIRGILERLCGAYGEALPEGDHAFPTAEVLAGLEPEVLREMGCGYRAEYLSSAAREVARGDLDLEALRGVSVCEARNRLLKVLGVGPKVADCILLYGLGKTECCPEDVWMKRVLAALGGEMPGCTAGEAGIAQQYLFYYARKFPKKFQALREFS